MILLSAFLYSLSSNLDNVVIGLAYGIKKIKIGILPNLLIALITSLGTLISMYVGKIITNFIPISIANILGGCIIILLGIYFVIQSICKIIKDNGSKSLSLKNMKEAINYT